MNIGRFAALSFLVAMGGIAACADNSTGPLPNSIPTGTALKFSTVIDSLFFGRSFSFTVADSADTLSTPPEYEWMSSDTTVAVVDATGNVLAVGHGEVRITVQREGARDTMRLRVVLQRAAPGIPLASGAEGGAMNGPVHCAIAVDGTMWCRSRSTSDSAAQFTRMPGAILRQFVSASTSLHAQCALDTDGAIHCWGNGARRSFARTTTVPTDTGPYMIQTPLRFLQMQHGGHAQTCGVAKQDSLVYCWGHNDFFQLGRNTNRADSEIPTPVDGIGKSRSVATENFSTCAIALDYRAHCSGLNGMYAGTGILDFLPQMTPVQGGHEFKTLSNGDEFHCGIDRDDKAWCWGRNRLGVVGIGDTTTEIVETPTNIAPTLRFKKIVAEYRAFACGISTDDDLYCWGNFPPLAVSTRMEEKRAAPVHVLKGIKFRDITGAMCGITTEGEALCW